MKPLPAIALAMWCAALPSHGLVVRSYSAATHDRFTGFPSAPVFNPTFLHTATRFTGVGWCDQAAHLQFTLVSPRHFLCANHSGAKPALGNSVSFLGLDGTVVRRTITALDNISNDTGGNSDLVVGTLDSPVLSTVTPLPYLNLASENNYLNRSLIVFGFNARGGVGTLSGFDTITESGEIAATRMCSFDYSTVGTGANDCRFEGGDSGSPIFSLSNNEPALVGTNSSVATVGAVIYRNYDTFIPHYVAKIDAFLLNAGYRVRPVTASATTVSLSSAASPATLGQAHAGSVTFSVANTGSALTGNVEATLTFPEGAWPDAVTMPDWIVESRGSGVWSLRKATLAANSTGVATASWTKLPSTASLTVATTLDSDATALATSSASFALQPTYAAWAAGLADSAETADPDGDGISNLAEYALGGDPATAGNEISPGEPLLPRINADGSEAGFSFPIRTDAAARGLSYTVEVSSTLETDSWQQVLPTGSATSTEPFDPEIPGFVRQHFSWPMGAAAFFVRLKIELNESF